MNDIHETAIIGDGVRIGSSNVIGPFAVLIGPLVIGDGNWIGPGVTIGTPPEVRSAPHVPIWNDVDGAKAIMIGSRNVLREGVSIQRANYRHTAIGDNCFVMSRAYIAHDCIVEDGVTISANVSLAGHCHIQAKSTLGLASTFHQFSVVGTGAMVGMSSAVTKDVPPYAMVYGVPGIIRGANTRGMSAHGFDEETIQEWSDSLMQDSHQAKSQNTDLIELKKSWLNAIEKVRLSELERF